MTNEENIARLIENMESLSRAIIMLCDGYPAAAKEIALKVNKEIEYE